MSGYSPRRAPNVSQYVANLNTIPPTYNTAQQDGLDLENDLAIFTNAEFFDFDLGENIEQPGVNYGRAEELRPMRSVEGRDGKDMNVTNGNYDFPELDPYLAATSVNHAPGQPAQAPYAQPHQSFPYPQHPNTASPTQYSPPTPVVPAKRPYPTSSSPASTNSPPATAASPSSASLEASSRAAAEEDKRRRNTAASARFRVKKKQREQALEKTAKEMTDRADALEARIQQLEMENKWLRNLVVEKTASGWKNGSDEGDVKLLWERFEKDRSSSSPKEAKGVGTEGKTKEAKKDIKEKA